MVDSKLSKKRKASSQPPSKKKIKVRHANSSTLPWKTSKRPLEAGIDADDGILELEEVDGVEVLYEEGGGGRIARFNVVQNEKDTDEDEDENEDELMQDVDEGAEHVEDIEEISEQSHFDSEKYLPNWHSFALHPQLLKSLHRRNFDTPTPIQEKSIPLALNGRDIVGVAQTGSGKTLAYGLPILHGLLQGARPKKKSKRPLRALILAPTRELALQVSSHLKTSLDMMEPQIKEEEDEDEIAAKVPMKKGKAKAKKREKTDSKEPKGTLLAKKAPPAVSIAAIVGGMSAQKQRRILDRGVDILVATPGRLWDMMQEDDSLATEIRHNLRFLVLDEADRMIEAGHFKELDAILRLTLKIDEEERIPNDTESVTGEEEEREAPSNTETQLQTFIFSATLSKELQRNVKKRSRPKYGGKKQNQQPASTLDDLLLRLDFRDPKGPEVIDLSPEDGVVDTLVESKVECLVTDKDIYLYYFLLRYPGRTLVFLSAIDGIRRLLPLLEMLDQKVYPIHSQLEMRQRLKNLDRFKSSSDSVLLATDIAARGLDIQGVDHVVHYQIPRSADVYVHRNGRTARAGGKGFSLLLVAPDERKVLAGVLGSFSSGRDAKSIPPFPIPDTKLLDKLKARVKLAKEIEGIGHKVRKANHEGKWMKEAADTLGVDLSDDDERKPTKKKPKQDAKLASMKAELKHLLSQPLLARGASVRYITSGSNPLATELIQQNDLMTSAGASPVMLGLGGGKPDAGKDVADAMKTKTKERKKSETKPRAQKKEDPDEWHGIEA
ncbi:ATP-dependent RNA helicase [Marasmius crinis-equi]|uniref:RNA helicase n=1 Tax=Marasmius crinis-equi TaxID=585013 RepID=A0ABR3FWS6_9AGAR